MPLPFRAPLLSDRDAVTAAANAVHAAENDISFVNLFLLRRKYQTEIAFHDEMLLRRYHSGVRAGTYGFPIGAGSLPAALSFLEADAAKTGQPLRLILLTKEQCALLETECPGQFSFSPMPEYTEYLYLRDALAQLKGSRYHGKRNHIAQFWRSFPDAEIQPLIAENVHFAVEIAHQWLGGKAEPHEPSVLLELDAIEEAAANWEALGLNGLLLYADGKPVGMTVVSEISTGIWDVHFEKVVPFCPHAWPVVANEMAKCLQNAEYINREEDLGESGMRTSKLSYHPDLLREKYLAVKV